MEEKDTSPKFSTLAIVAFAVALILCLIELDLVNTPLDAYLQRGSAVLGVLAKLAMLLKKFIF